jgi:hypothetical protein
VRHVACPPEAPTRRERRGQARLVACDCQAFINIARLATASAPPRWGLGSVRCASGRDSRRRNWARQ